MFCQRDLNSSDDLAHAKLIPSDFQTAWPQVRFGSECLRERLPSQYVSNANSNSCTQYIHGLVDDDDLEILRSYSSLVTEFILSDVEKDKPIIAPSTFVRIARFLGPNSGLLPSLLRLRIIQADNYFLCLDLLHTPSLRSLEANVPDHQHPNFFSFLTTLVHKAPLLDEIILGPGQFPLKSLQEILRFTHLRQLELRDVASSIDFTFLQDVGTLSNLESFILDARSCTYTARILEEPSNTPPVEHIEVGNQMPLSSDIDSSAVNEDTAKVREEAIKLSSDIDNDKPSLIIDSSLSRSSTPTIQINEDEEVIQPLPAINNQILCNNDSSISLAGGFYQLKKFHFVGGLSLLQDMIFYIASSTLEDISITVIHLSPQDLRQELEAENMSQAVRRRALDRESHREIVAIGKKKKTLYLSRQQEISEKRQEILEKAETRWKEQEAQYQAQYKERKKAEKVQNRQKHTTILQAVSSRWSAVLKTVRFNNLDGSPQPLPTLPVFPKVVYESLFCYPNLEILEFKQWKLDSVGDLLLSMKSSCPQNLKQIHLPIDDPSSVAISLSGLLDLAEACPKLESLHCCIDTLSPIPEYSIPTTKALSHGLQSLFVANNPTSTSLWDFNQLLLVARHFYLTFPCLQTINSVEGPNAEQWVRIHALVKMLQVARHDDVLR